MTLYYLSNGYGEPWTNPMVSEAKPAILRMTGEWSPTGKRFVADNPGNVFGPAPDGQPGNGPLLGRVPNYVLKLTVDRGMDKGAGYFGAYSTLDLATRAYDFAVAAALNRALAAIRRESEQRDDMQRRIGVFPVVYERRVLPVSERTSW